MFDTMISFSGNPSPTIYSPSLKPSTTTTTTSSTSSSSKQTTTTTASTTSTNAAQSKVKGGKRASKPKVRTGCLTCKQRRVKCDEQHPYCQRCIKAGVECLGYASKHTPAVRAPIRPLAPRQASTQSIQSLSACSLSPPISSSWDESLTPDQNKSFEYFRNKTAPEMSNIFAARGFWEGQVLRMCQAEPCLRDAAIALGMLHEMYTADPYLRAPTNTPNDPMSARALSQYNKAVSGVRERLSTFPSNAAELALISCLLFLGIDILLSRFDDATRHVQNAFYIFREWRPSCSEPPEIGHANCFDDLLPNNNITIKSEEQSLADQFVRLNFNTAFAGVENRLPSPNTPLPDIFTTFIEARLHLAIISELIVNFIHELEDSNSLLQPSEYEYARQSDLLDRLRSWHDVMNESRMKYFPRLQGHERNTLLVLRTQYVGLAIMIDTALSGAREMDMDRHEPQFVEVLDIITDLLESPDSEPLPTLCFDVGVIYPLFSVALKCRNPSIRRRAIRLLDDHPRREGTLDSSMTAFLVKHVVELEEAGFDGLQHAWQLPEFARFHQVYMTGTLDGKDNWLVCKRLRHDTGEWVVIRHPLGALPSSFDDYQGRTSEESMGYWHTPNSHTATTRSSSPIWT